MKAVRRDGWWSAGWIKLVAELPVCQYWSSHSNGSSTSKLRSRLGSERPGKRSQFPSGDSSSRGRRKFREDGGNDALFLRE